MGPHCPEVPSVLWAVIQAWCALLLARAVRDGDSDSSWERWVGGGNLPFHILYTRPHLHEYILHFQVFQ